MRNTPLRTLLVDDEPVARQILREELEQIVDVTIAGEAENGEQALDQIRQLGPDVVFLDLQMPGLSGFEVIRSLNAAPLPIIIIVTAFDQYALAAFEAGAIDYLLKPVSPERLARCVQRVKQLRSNPLAAAITNAALQDIAHRFAPGRTRKVVGKLGDEFHLLETSQVLAFQAERELVWIITRRQRYLASDALKTIQTRLSDLNFARIHRGALVNLDHVAKMAPLSSQRWLLTLGNNQEFVVSKRQASTVQRQLRGE